MKRRDVLALCGAAAAGLAGCTSNASDDGGDADTATDTIDADPTVTTTPTDTTTPDPTTEPDPTSSPEPEDSALSVSLDALQPGVVELTNPDSIGVSGRGQSLFLDVEVVAGDAPAASEFAFVVGDTVHEPVTELRRVYRQYNHQSAYDPVAGEGWILFELPEVGDYSNARLTWGNGEWRPEDSLVERLSNPFPDLDVSVSIPESVPRGEDPTIEATVTNEGDLPTRFVAGVNRQGAGFAYIPVDYVSLPVDPGATETWTVSDDLRISVQDGDVGDGSADMSYNVLWSDGSENGEVRITE